jgi:hypothetical protein
MGIYPKPFLEMIEQPVDAIVARVRPEYFEGTGITPPPLPLPASPAAAVAGELSGRPEGGSLAELLERQQVLGALIDAR